MEGWATAKVRKCFSRSKKRPPPSSVSLQVKERRVELGDGQGEKIAKCFGGIEGGKKAAAELSNKESRATAKGGQGDKGEKRQGEKRSGCKKAPSAASTRAVTRGCSRPRGPEGVDGSEMQSQGGD